MRRKLLLSVFAAMLLCLSGSAQKKALTHDVYDSWKRVGRASSLLTDDGSVAVYDITPQYGDGKLVVHYLDKGTTTDIDRGATPRLFGAQRWLAYGIRPEREAVRQADIKKVARDKRPKTTYAVMELSSGRVIEAPETTSVEAAADAPVVAFIYKPKPAPADTAAVADSAAVKKPQKPKALPDRLLVVNVASNDTLLNIEYATKFTMDRSGTKVLYTAKRDSVYSLWAWSGGEPVMIRETVKGAIGQMALDSWNGRRFAFTYIPDSTVTKQYELYDVTFSGLAEQQVLFTQPGLTFSNDDPVRYSREGGLLHYSLARAPRMPVKDTVPSGEKFVLDVWNYRDTLIQSQQFVQRSDVIKYTFQAMRDLNNGYDRLLKRNYFERVRMPGGRDDAPFYVISDNSPYAWSASWERSPRPYDYWLYRPATDSREKVLEAHRGSFIASPAGRWILFFDTANGHWKSMDPDRKAGKVLTEGLGVNFYDEMNDTPGPARDYGMGGWIEVKGRRGQSSELAVVYDFYDLWLLDPSGVAPPRRLTKGREQQKIFRVQDISGDYAEGGGRMGGGRRMGDYLNDQPEILLTMLNYDTKVNGLYSLAFGRDGNVSAAPEKMLQEGEYGYKFVAKAKDRPRMIWSRDSYSESPDLYMGGLDMSREVRLTDANPQAREYAWGTPRLIRWIDPHGRPVDGQLLLPEDYVEGKKYPVVVYFYERSSENLFTHRYPEPSWSIIRPPMFTSNGYVVFIPDINFRVGYPGPSALDAVVSGSEELIRRGIADPDRIGLQGQSWGGYQINYIITQTDMFRCACAGAGVSDMVSGYATTRDDSGSARMMQYEGGQSRIGASLAESPDLYILNSPVFHLQNVNTPILLRHSDNDNAVPFMQSMEMFNGLRRLGKQVWLLNYHGERHNMRTWQAKMDYTLRMHQFFDHYLKDEPMPRWMSEGISLRDRGLDLKLDY